MNTINLKHEVRRAVRGSWASFEREHPSLARVIDRELLVEQARRSLLDDPEYRRALEQSRAVGIGTHALITFVERFVSEWLSKLV